MTKYFCAALIVWRPTLFHRGSELQDLFAPSTQKKNKQHLCRKKRTALSAGGLEASAEESDDARYAIRSLNRYTIKMLLGGGGGGQRKLLKVGSSAGGALPYKPIRNVPFFSINS